MAKDLDIQRGSGELLISFSWRTPGMWFLLFFSVLWDLFIVFFLFMGAGIFIGLHLLAGVFITWYTLTRFMNKTTMRVDRRELTISHGPVPWPFAKERLIPARSLVQLWVDKSGVKVNNQPTYNLLAKLDTGVEVKLLSSELSKDLLQQLETTIETYLDIKNDPSFGLDAGGDFGQLDLEQLQEQMKKLEKVKKWLPKSVVTKMEAAEARVKAEVHRKKSGTGPGYPTPEATDAKDVALNFPASGPRPLPTSDHDFSYPLYRARRGDRLRYTNERYEAGRSAQLDFEDEHITTGRQLELVPLGAGGRVNIYAQIERDRWSYYEERRLDDDEVATLGFTGEIHPLRFDNGSDRYYPRDEQRGVRYFEGHPQPVQQFIYFTTASTTLFRSLKPTGRGWEVYVMEVVDASSFQGE